MSAQEFIDYSILGHPLPSPDWWILSTYPGFWESGWLSLQDRIDNGDCEE